MSRSADRTRTGILEAAYRLFRKKGFVRVGVDEIALAAGVTKRTLYYHYGSKDALLAAVLAAQHEQMFAAFRTIGDDLTGSAGDIVGELFRRLAAWSAEPGWAGSGFTRLAMELADLPGHPARAVASTHKAALEGYLAGRLARAGVASPGARAREVWLLAEGAMVLILIHGDRSYVDAASGAARRLVGEA